MSRRGYRVTKRPAKAIADSERLTARYQESWDVLARLADAGELIGFWREYAAYLEANGLESDSRRIIHRMALATVSALCDRKGE